MLPEPEPLETSTTDGVTLALRRYRPREARAAALVTHAMMASGASVAAMARALAGHGIDAFVLDFRGHGGSRPPDPRRDAWGFDDYVERDLPAALARVAGATGRPVEDVRYVGHSLGGLVGLGHAARAAVDARPAPRRLALVATSCWRLDARERASRDRRGVLRRQAAMATYLATAQALGYAPIRRLGLGSDDEPARYVAELVSWARTGRWVSRRSGFDVAAGLARVRAELLLVYGGGDWMCDRLDTERLVDELAAARPRVLEVSRRTGFGFAPDHFGLVRSPRAAAVWAEIAAFLLA